MNISIENRIKKDRNNLRLNAKFCNIDLDNLKRGQKEMLIILYINGMAYTFIKNSKEYILPSYEYIAKVVGCTKQWVSEVIIKISKKSQIKKIDKTDLDDEQVRWCKFKLFVWIISDIFNNFKDLELYFFKTGTWKNNLKKIKENKSHQLNLYDHKNKLINKNEHKNNKKTDDIKVDHKLEFEDFDSLSDVQKRLIESWR